MHAWIVGTILTLLNPVAAEEQVAADSSASGIEYFTYETVQLTDSAVSNLTATVEDVDASIFAFGDAEDEALRKRALSSCKLHPDDSLWPSKLVWNVFDLLLGGRLIEAVPLSAVCYPDWPQYDEDKCDIVTANWNDPAYLYVLFFVYV